jgi:hypothetical protein
VTARRILHGSTRIGFVTAGKNRSVTRMSMYRSVRPLVGVMVALGLLSQRATGAAQTEPRPDADPRIERLLSSISEQRLRDLIATLARFGTRETLSTAGSPSRGIAAAAEWIRDELTRSSPRLQVAFDTYRLAPQSRIQTAVELRNVIATLPGRTARRIYVTGHYDSVSFGARGQLGLVATPGAGNPQGQPDFNHDAEAPGANDDASGTALTMELARVFADSGVTFDATLVFACWAGEEQGSYGSAAHAQRLVKEKVVVDAMMADDIVGNSHGGSGVADAGSVRIYSAGPEDSMSRALARYIARTAAIYVPSHHVHLMAREDRFGRGSDHVSFNTAGFPAVVFREANEDFSRQHGSGDTPDGVDVAYLARNARVNAAAAASLALAPPAPGVAGRDRLSRGPSGYDANLRWQASPGAVAYRIYWRDTWNNDWEHARTVGNVTQFVFPNVSIDDLVFGVAAIGADGQESLVSAYVAPVRSSTPVKLVD